MPVRTLLSAALALLLAVPALAQGVLRVVSPWEILSLEPSRTGYVFARMEVAETLLGADGGGLPVPGLARTWTPSGDGLTWRLTLRESAVFHDGTPVTAEAAAASLRRAKAQPGPFDRPGRGDHGAGRAHCAVAPFRAVRAHARLPRAQQHPGARTGVVRRRGRGTRAGTARNPRSSE